MRFNGNPTTINEFSIFLDKSNRKTSIYLYRFFGIYFIQANIFWHYAAMNIGQLSYMQWTFDYDPLYAKFTSNLSLLITLLAQELQSNLKERTKQRQLIL